MVVDRFSSTKAAITGVCLLVAACSVGDDYQRPDTVTPSAWTNSHETANTWPSAEWWHSFGAPQLDEAMTAAQSANFDLAVAIAQVRQADAAVHISGASLLPAVDAASSITRAHTPTKSSGSYSSNTFEPTISASYELDFWGKKQGRSGFR